MKERTTIRAFHTVAGGVALLDRDVVAVPHVETMALVMCMSRIRCIIVGRRGIDDSAVGTVPQVKPGAAPAKQGELVRIEESAVADDEVDGIIAYVYTGGAPCAVYRVVLDDVWVRLRASAFPALFRGVACKGCVPVDEYRCMGCAGLGGYLDHGLDRVLPPVLGDEGRAKDHQGANENGQ